MTRSRIQYTPSMVKALSSADSEIKKAQGRLKVGLYLSDALQKDFGNMNNALKSAKQYDQISELVNKNPDLKMPSKYEFMSGNQAIEYKDMFSVDASDIQNLDLLYNKKDDLLKVGEALGFDLTPALEQALEIK